MLKQTVMIVKSFVLKPHFIENIARRCGKDTVVVIRPGKKIEGVFRDAIRKTILEKGTADQEIQTILDFFRGMSEDPAYLSTVDTMVQAVSTYLREAMYVQTSLSFIEDYVMAKCARLCAEAVNSAVHGTLIDGTGLMLCTSDAKGDQHFDWAASRQQIAERCKGEGPLVISGGYGRLTSGYIVRVGKDGAHLMASLIAVVLKAESIEFHIESRGVAGIPAMTYDEAAHFCASSQAPFSSSAIWPAKNAGIPILVKDISDENFEGTIISSGSSHKTGVLCDRDLDLITVYGTGLLGRVGMSGAIFSCLASSGVNVRFIAQTSSEYSISFAVHNAEKDAALEAIRGLFRENPLLPLDDVVVLNQAVGIVTVFGSRMKNVPGISGKVFGILGQAGINIIASAQGGEELSISLVVDESVTDKAAELLK